MAGEEKCTLSTDLFIILYYISEGVFNSVVPELAIKKVCYQMYNSTICEHLSSGKYPTEEDIVYSEATTWYSNSVIFCAIPSAITIMFLGAISDILSKRKLLLLIPIMDATKACILMISGSFRSSFVILVVAMVMPSVYGGNQGAPMLACSYMADVTEASHVRTVRLNILEGLNFLSLGIGNFVSGFLINSYGFNVALLLSLSSAAANIVFVIFLLPEINATQHENDAEEAKKTPTKPFVEKLSICWAYFKKTCLLIKKFTQKYLLSLNHIHVILLLIATFFTTATISGENVILVVFLQHTPLSLSETEVGFFLLFLQCVRGIGVIILALFSLTCCKSSDVVIIVLGQVSIIAIYLAVGLSKDRSTLFSVIPLTIALPMALSGMTSMLTKMVDHNENGTVLSFEAFFSIVGIIVMSVGCASLFNMASTYLPGSSVILLAISGFCGLLAALAAFYSTMGCLERKKTKKGTEINRDDEGNALLSDSDCPQSFD